MDSLFSLANFSIALLLLFDVTQNAREANHGFRLRQKISIHQGMAFEWHKHIIDRQGSRASWQLYAARRGSRAWQGRTDGRHIVIWRIKNHRSGRVLRHTNVASVLSNCRIVELKRDAVVDFFTTP